MQRLSVELRSPTLPGIEALVGTDLIDHTGQDFLPLQQRNADGIGSILMNEVRRTVKRVYPSVMNPASGSNSRKAPTISRSDPLSTYDT